LSGPRQNANIADTLHLRDVAMAASFWLLMGYDFGCMIASDTLFNSREKTSSGIVVVHSFPYLTVHRCWGKH